MIKRKEEVRDFLKKVKKLIAEGKVQINNLPWKGNRVNKTLAYMAETGIQKEAIEKVICELDITNYCYTDDDHNVHFKEEKVWIFGITKNMIDQSVDLYIKLKIRVVGDENLLIMSFHPEEPAYDKRKLEFPYKEYELNERKE